MFSTKKGAHGKVIFICCTMYFKRRSSWKAIFILLEMNMMWRNRRVSLFAIMQVLMPPWTCILRNFRFLCAQLFSAVKSGFLFVQDSWIEMRRPWRQGIKRRLCRHFLPPKTAVVNQESLRSQTDCQWKSNFLRSKADK